MAFISRPDSGGFSDFLDKRRKRKFVSGNTGTGLEEDSAVLEASLGAAAERNTRLAALSNEQENQDRNFAENQRQFDDSRAQQQSQFDESRAQQQSQFEAAQATAFNRDERAEEAEDRARRSALVGAGVGFAGDLIQSAGTRSLASSVLGVTLPSAPTAASIGKGILKFFGF
jgi:hypothetical protein